MNIKKALLAKQIDSELHYVYPRTSADLVDYSKGSSTTNLQSEIDSINSNIESNNNTLVDRCDTIESNLNSIISRVNALNGSKLNFDGTGHDSIYDKVNTVSYTATEANTKASSNTDRIVSLESTVSRLDNNMNNLYASSVKYTNSVTVDNKLRSLSSASGISYGNSNVQDVIANLITTVNNNDNTIKNILNKIYDDTISTEMFNTTNVYSTDSAYKHYDISTYGKNTINDNGSYRIGNLIHLGIEYIHIELNTFGFCNIPGRTGEAIGNIMINNFIDTTKFPKSLFGLNFSASNANACFDTLEVRVANTNDTLQIVDASNPGGTSATYDVNSNKLTINNVVVRSSLDDTELIYLFYRSDNSKIFDNNYKFNNWWR